MRISHSVPLSPRPAASVGVRAGHCCPRSSTPPGRVPILSPAAIRRREGRPPFPRCWFPSRSPLRRRRRPASRSSWTRRRTCGACCGSPVFSKFAFPSGGTTQYVDAMLRTTFPKAEGWHTLLGKPEVKPVRITVPLGLRLHPHFEEDRRLLRRCRPRVSAKGGLQAGSQTGRQARHRHDAQHHLLCPW